MTEKIKGIFDGSSMSAKSGNLEQKSFSGKAPSLERPATPPAQEQATSASKPAASSHKE